MGWRSGPVKMELFTDLRGRKRSPGYIPLFDDALLADEPVKQDAVTPEERDSVLAEIGELTGGTLARAADLLQMPGDYVRGFLANRTGERVTGRDLLRSAGLAGQEDNWGNWAAGLATEFVTDPLALLSGPAKALTPAGKAAAKLAGPVGNLLDTAPTAMTRKAISTGMADEALPMVARRTKKALEGTGRTISTMDPATVGRPLYGTRTARRAGTLDDLIKYADDPDAAEEAARNLLGGDLDTLRNQPLAKSFGIGLPFGDPLVVGDALGKGFGDTYADVLDTVGQGIRWSYPGRLAAAGFDAKVGGAIDPEDQITNISDWRNRKVGGAGATYEHTLQMARLSRAHPEVFSREGNDALGRYLEGPAVRTADDVAYVESRPQLKAYAEWADDKRGTMLAESKAAGLNAAPLQDQYGLLWVPRRADPALEMQSRRDRKLGAALSTLTTDALRRTDAMSLPGGRATIMDLSQDTMISGGKRTLRTDEEAAQYVMNKVNSLLQPGQPAIDIDKARRVARIMNALPDEVVQKAPLFGQHPTDMFGSAVRDKAEAIGTTKTLYDSLATFAVNRPYNTVDGGRHISLQSALDRLGLKSYKDDLADDIFEVADDGTARSLEGTSGAAQQMRERLSQLTGRNADEINLNEFSIPEEQVARLTRARDLYSSGEASKAILDRLDHWTAAWKGGILMWPSRAVRDLYSGAISNWLEGALDPAAVSAAKSLIMSGPDSPEFQKLLRSIGRYNTDDGLSQFYADLASTGLLGGSTFTDAGASVQGLRALDAMVGRDPITLTSIGRELGQGWNRKDFWNWRSSLKPLAETTNPLMRAGERLNSLTDGINRMTGYLSLLKQGYDPMAAAAAMKRAHVDYSSLTGFERNLLKRFFPWYSYQSRIFGEVLRQLAERPGGRYGQMIHATESVQDESDEGKYVPSDLRSQFAFPIPADLGGQPAPGTQTYLTGVGIPGFSELQMLGTPKSMGRQVGMQLHPLARMAVEGMVGQDLFTNRPLGEATSPADAIARSVTGNPNADVPFLLDKGLEVLPFTGRPLYMARSLLDNRGGQSLGHRVGKTVLNTTTGLRFRDKTEGDTIPDAVRMIEESIDPYTRDFKQVYIPEAMQPSVPQWALRRLAVARALSREQREARKPKDGKKSKKKAKSDAGMPTLFE